MFTLEEFAEKATKIMKIKFSTVTIGEKTKKLSCSFLRIMYDKGEVTQKNLNKKAESAIDFALIHVVNVMGLDHETY